jgi:hypothetical protein
MTWSVSFEWPLLSLLIVRISHFGCFDWFKGDRYEGEWKKEMFHGTGIYTVVHSSERSGKEIIEYG